MDELLKQISDLRNQTTGCPWTREQDFMSILPYTIEETYEVAHAIESNDFASLKEELGDLLYQIIFYAQMADERGKFNFADVVENLQDKITRRNPQPSQFSDAASVNAHWRKQKALEKQHSSAEPFLNQVAHNLPSLLRAQKIQIKAGEVGFDWQNVEQIIEKLEEEIAELREVLAANPNNPNRELLQAELGDILFSSVNIGRYLKLNCETALRGCTQKFITRFNYIEQQLLHNNISLNDADFDTMMSLWDEAKLINPTQGALAQKSPDQES